MIKSELQYLMSNEKLVNEALHVALGEINATTSIEKFLEKLGTSMLCDRIYIFEGKKNCSVNNTFEWCAEGVSAEIDSLQNVPYEAVSWWYDIFDTYIGSTKDYDFMNSSIDDVPGCYIYSVELSFLCMAEQMLY